MDPSTSWQARQQQPPLCCKDKPKEKHRERNPDHKQQQYQQQQQSAPQGANSYLTNSHSLRVAFAKNGGGPQGARPNGSPASHTPRAVASANTSSPRKRKRFASKILEMERQIGRQGSKVADPVQSDVLNSVPAAERSQQANSRQCTIVVPAMRGPRAAMMTQDKRSNRSAAQGENVDKKVDDEASPHASARLRKELADALMAREASEAELRRMTKENSFKNDLIESQRSTLSYIYEQASCNVCLELAWKPHVLSPCGHTFCAPCLVSWFTTPLPTERGSDSSSHESEQVRRRIMTKATLRRRKICPQCRTEVTTRPAEVFAIKGMIYRLHQAQMLGQIAGEASTIPQRSPADEESLRCNNLPSDQPEILWTNIFDDNPARKIFDAEDDCYRCSRCMGEVVWGECQSCGEPYSDSNEENYDNSDTDGGGVFWGNFLDDEAHASHSDSDGDGYDDENGVATANGERSEVTPHRHYTLRPHHGRNEDDCAEESEMEGFIVDDDEDEEDDDDDDDGNNDGSGTDTHDDSVSLLAVATRRIPSGRRRGYSDEDENDSFLDDSDKDLLFEWDPPHNCASSADERDGNNDQDDDDDAGNAGVSAPLRRHRQVYTIEDEGDDYDNDDDSEDEEEQAMEIVHRRVRGNRRAQAIVVDDSESGSEGDIDEVLFAQSMRNDLQAE